MRIIAGKFKGRRLVSFKADHIRPTTDRVKETVFNILQARIDGAEVLDLFSGTGNLAIESLSRGAVKVVAVESHRRSLEIIKKNLSELKIESDITVVAKDVFRYIESYKGDGFDVILVDPPFTEKLSHSVMEAIQETDLLKVDGILLIESQKKENILDSYKGFKLLDRRDFGDKKVSIYTREI